MTKLIHNWKVPPSTLPSPDFNNLLSVLKRELPSRPTLFEFFLNGPLNQKLSQTKVDCRNNLENYLRMIWAFKNAGYDYSTILLPDFFFPGDDIQFDKTISLNDGSVIFDRDSFDKYQWPDPDDADYSLLDKLGEELPDGMKLIIHAPGGVLENIIRIVGFDNICFMTLDNPNLLEDIFEEIGTRLLKYYKNSLKHKAVGVIIGNDDWGFKTQTMLSPADMRKLVFPWHKKFVAAAHEAGIPAILHSCGCLGPVMDDVIDDMHYDGKHSYEDSIQPVEDAYEQYHKRIAILGGIDVDFVCRMAPEDVYNRSKNMLKISAEHGAYALGTGNSVPEYVPDENYFAMIQAVHDFR